MARPLELAHGEVLSCLSPGGDSLYFEVTRAIGAGGSGVVYECVSDDGRFAVVKGPHTIGARDLGLATEARVLAKVPRHPNLIELLATHSDPRGHELIVLERVFPNPLEALSRGDVRARLDRRHDPGHRFAPPPASVALELGYELALALAHLHQHKVVHCDVKPQNVLLRVPWQEAELSDHEYFKALVEGRWETVLIDLGGARSFKALRDASAGVKGAPLPALTPIYAPPEVLPGAYEPETGRERSRFSPWIDTYAFGLTLYQLLTGRAPYDHLERPPDDRDLASVAATKREERDGAFLPIARAALDAVDWSDCTLREDPAGRYATREALAERLWELLSQTVHYEPSRRGTMLNMRQALGDLLGVTPTPEAGPRGWRQGRLVLDPFTSRLALAGRDGTMSDKADLKKLRRGGADFWEMQGFSAT